MSPSPAASRPYSLSARRHRMSPPATTSATGSPYRPRPKAAPAPSASDRPAGPASPPYTASPHTSPAVTSVTPARSGPCPPRTGPRRAGAALPLFLDVFLAAPPAAGRGLRAGGAAGRDVTEPAAGRFGGPLRPRVPDRGGRFSRCGFARDSLRARRRGRHNGNNSNTSNRREPGPWSPRPAPEHSAMVPRRRGQPTPSAHPCSGVKTPIYKPVPEGVDLTGRTLLAIAQRVPSGSWRTRARKRGYT